MSIPEAVYRKRLIRSGVPVKHVGKALDDWQPYDDASKRALRDVWSFVEAFPRLLMPEDLSADIDPQVGQGIAMIGEPGAGKTTLGCMILREIHQRYEKRVVFKTFADYIAMLQEQMALQKAFENGEPQATERWWAIHRSKAVIFNSPLVYFDDVGKEYRTHTGYAVTEFDRVIRWRFRNGTPTVLSTNVRLDDWEKVYGSAMASFIHEAFHIIEIGGRDLRLVRV